MQRTAVFFTLAALLCCHTAFARVRHARPRLLTMHATAFAQTRQATAAGTSAREGIVAADPRVLPLGTRIRISGSGGYNGEYLVTDTGSAVKGRHIDVFLRSRREARRFGRRRVLVEILKLGTGPADARAKDEKDEPR